MKAGGSVCDERIPGFSDKFEPWFAQWQRKRFAQLSRGPAAIAHTQQEHRVNYEELIRQVGEKLRQAEAGVANRECSLLLEAVEPYLKE